MRVFEESLYWRDFSTGEKSSHPSYTTISIEIIWYFYVKDISYTLFWNSGVSTRRSLSFWKTIDVYTVFFQNADWCCWMAGIYVLRDKFLRPDQGWGLNFRIWSWRISSFTIPERFPLDRSLLSYKRIRPSTISPGNRREIFCSRRWGDRT